MRIAYATTFNARDVHNWSGTPFHMARAFEAEDVQVEYLGGLKKQLPPFFKLKQTFKKYISNQRESPRFNTYAARHYSTQIAKQLSHLSVDAIVSPLINPIAYLDCDKPIVLWTDAVYASLLGFYPAFAYHSPATISEGNAMTYDCLKRATLAIFSSDWAANNAIELYGISRDKIKVVPFGANIETYPTFHEIKSQIEKRKTHTIKLLFLAKSWERKGGDIAVNVAKALHHAGHSVELNIVGITPKLEKEETFIRCLGYISKQTAEGKKQISDLLSQSHFLILPSRADACPMVFAEANAHGLPCLASHVGGIATAVRDNVNGKTFALDASMETYVSYILNLMQNKNHYDELAYSSYQEYETRLNWKSSVVQVKKFISEL